MKELPFREIHLDFHTSPDIGAVGSRFDPEEFAATLAAAHVNSISCFARCHHGMIYYDSKVNPERVHPGLVRKDLLREQIEACHRHGIRVPIYTTVQWDQLTAREHPEWLVRNEDGSVHGQKPYEPGFYGSLCVNTPYRDFLKAHVKEILQTLPTDGLFFDIVGTRDCSCEYCRKAMTEKGLEPHKREDRLAFATSLIGEFMRDMSAFVRLYNKDCGIFYNASTIGPVETPLADAFSHFELESLPSGVWGYQNFPLVMRYARNFGLDCLSHTGKFHTEWGDFHSFKNRAALEFECFHMLALNAKCLIGDQLEPSGRLSPAVYDLIGSVYSQVEAKEPWCSGTRALVDIGVFDPKEFGLAKGLSLDDSLIGVGRMLQESGQQFDVIDTRSDFSRYRVLVLPDSIPVNPELDAKLARYLAAGGSVIASCESGLDETGGAFGFKAAGVRLLPDQTRDLAGNLVRGRYYDRHDYADYLLPKGPIASGLPETEHVMYMKGAEVEAEAGSEVLADAVLPYYNRDYRHFCSHRQAPSSGIRGYAGIVKRGRVIYFAHPIFRQYDRNAPHWCKVLFRNALDMFLPDPVLRHSGPSGLIATVNEQEKEKRLVAHLLYYVPERRSKNIDIIEDVIPLFGVKLSINPQGRKIRSVSLVPQGAKLPFTSESGRIEFVIPEINGHQMVCMDLDK
jgi:hypothetical protein